MHSKRKITTFNLVAIIVLLIVFLCCIGSLTYATAESRIPQASDEIRIEAMASNEYEDFSSYTDQELLDKIDRNNIKQYVPVDKFNTDRYIIHNGRNYGFIIFNDAKTNHVLLFKETITNAKSYDYEVEFKVLYTNAFFKTGNSILNANSPYSIALSNIKFSEYIIDTKIDENVTDFSSNKIYSSPYFWRAGLSGDVSFLDKDKTRDSVSINLLEVDSTAKPEQALSYNVSDLTTNSVKGNKGLVTATFNGGTNYIGSKYDPRSIEIMLNAGSDDFLANKNDKQDYLKASFELSSISEKNYYIYNNISFDICLYNALQVKKEVRIASESVYSPTDNSTSEYGILERSENGGYTLKEYQRLEPLLNNYGVFNFAPDKARDYKIETPSGYYATVNNELSNSDNLFAINGQNNIVGFASEIGSQSKAAPHGKRLLAHDFIGGEINFANIIIKREQELKLGETYLNQEIPTYRMVKTSEMSNNLYTLDTTGYTGNIDLHILDENADIIQTSTRYGKELVINYPYLADKRYYIVCDNQSYTAQSLNFTDRGTLDVSDRKYPSIENMYYKFTVPKYTQYYQTFAKHIVDEQMNAVQINDGNALLESGKTYYLQSGISRLMTNISDNYVKNITKLGETIECSQDINEVFEFIPKVSAQYNFDYGTYDVYRNWTLIAEDVNNIYLNESEIAYQIVQRQKGENFVLDLLGDELHLGLNNINQSQTSNRNQYVIYTDERMRIDYTVNPEMSVYFYDAYLNLIEFAKGYPLPEGKNYIFIDSTESGTITIEEYLQRVNVELYVDGEKYEYNRDLYYGKDLILPVPVKARHNFMGWSNGNGLVTDANGQGNEILEDSMILNAVWQLRGIVVKVSSNGEFWWDGQTVSKQEVSPVFIDEDIDSIYNKIVSLVESTPECIKVGYYNKYYNFRLTSSDELNDYYSLIASTEKEKYRIRFEIFGSYYYTNGSVAYGDTIKSANFPQEVLNWSNREYAIVSWRISASSQNVSITSGMTVADLTPGRGSNNGTLGYSNVYLTANISYVSYKFNINGNLYEIPRTHSYKIETLEDYGYNASAFYGYNVSFKDSKGRVYYIDDAVFVSDLYDFWSYGNVNVIIDLNIVSTPIKVNLTYLVYGDGKLVEPDKNTSAKYYQGGNSSYSLNAAQVRGWVFDGWKINNKSITQLSYANLNVTNYYSTSNSVELSREITTELTADKRYPNQSGTTIRIESSGGVVRIYGKSYGLSNYKFIITPSVTQITFVGGRWYDTSIAVEDTKQNITLFFDNVYIKAKSNQSVIYTERSIETLYSYGTTEIVAGDVNQKGAQAAIVATDNLAFGGESFIIRGGNSKDAYIPASYGIKCEGSILSFAKKIEVYGGNGVDGADGINGVNGKEHMQQNGESGAHGGHGGHGATAIYAYGIGIFTKNSHVICYGGNGGDGGNGGNGGNGSDGRNGSVGVTTIAPGNGGNGGNAGYGGYGAVAAIFKVEHGILFPDSSSIEYVPGKHGEAGTAGKAGRAGKTSYTIWDNPKYGNDGNAGENGEAGQDGDEGYLLI